MVLVFIFSASLLFKSLMPIDVSRDVFLPCSFFFVLSSIWQIILYYRRHLRSLQISQTVPYTDETSSSYQRQNSALRNTQLSSSAIKLASSFFILFFFKSPRIHGNRSLSRPMHRSRCFVVSTLSRYWSEPQHMSILTLSRFSRSLPFCRA